MKNVVTLLLLAAITLTYGCGSDDDGPTAVEPSAWEEDERFLFENKVQFNSFADDENLFFMGRQFMSHITIADGMEQIEISGFFLQHSTQFQMPVSSELFLTANERIALITSTQNPVSDVSNFYLDMEKVDPGFQGFDFPHFSRSQAMAINSRNQCLIPYVTEGHWNLLLADVTLRANEIVDTLQTQIYSQPNVSFGWTRLNVFDDVFYVSRLNGTYRIDATREMRQVTDVGFYRMFEVDDTLYGLDFDELYASQDGITWAFIGNLDPVFSELKFTKIENKTIAFRFSQIWIVEETAEGFNITELDNEGLFGHQINSIAVFNGKVYLSTFSGVFSKDLEDFFEEKVVTEE